MTCFNNQLLFSLSFTFFSSPRTPNPSPSRLNEVLKVYNPYGHVNPRVRCGLHVSTRELIGQVRFTGQPKYVSPNRPDPFSTLTLIWFRWPCFNAVNNFQRFDIWSFLLSNKITCSRIFHIVLTSFYLYKFHKMS